MQHIVNRPSRRILALLTGLVIAFMMTSPGSAIAYSGFLTTSSATPAVGEPVIVTANISPTPRNYRYWWGDGTYQKFSSSTTATKTYSKAGTYRIVVDAAAGGRKYLNVAVTTVVVGGSGLGQVPAPAPVPVPADAPAPVPGGRPNLAYSVDSYFRSTVSGAAVDTAATAEFHQFMSTHPAQKAVPYPVLRGVDGNKWGTTYAMGMPGDVLWKLTGNIPSQAADLETTGFYAPANLADELTLTSDSPFVVHDRVRGQTVWGAKAVKQSGNVIQVGAAGRFMHASNGLDHRNPRSTDKERNVRSRGAIPDGMVIRKDLMDYAIANSTSLGHVLHFFIVESDSAAGFRHPMVGEESDKFGFGAEGQRLAIRPDVDLTRRGLSPEGLVIARTLQTHGMYIGDNAGSASSLKAEQESPTNPVWNGRLQADELRGISWADFYVVA